MKHQGTGINYGKHLVQRMPACKMDVKPYMMMMILEDSWVILRKQMSLYYKNHQQRRQVYFINIMF